MIICAAGDIHGAMDRMYEDVLAFESALGVRFEWVLHVGDFGVWPDPKRIVAAFAHYLAVEELRITRAMFEQNLAEKLLDPRFAADLGPLLAHGHTWARDDAARQIRETILSLLPGEPWKGAGTSR